MKTTKLQVAAAGVLIAWDQFANRDGAGDVDKMVLALTALRDALPPRVVAAVDRIGNAWQRSE